MQFIKPEWKKIEQLSPRDITNYTKENYFKLSVEDYHRLLLIKDNIIESNRKFRDKFLACDIMKLAFKQTSKELPNATLMTERDKKVRPDLWENFKDRLFSNAEKILRYKEREKGLAKRRAKKKNLTK